MQKTDYLRHIGIYQIIGGVIGWLVVGWAVISEEGQSKNLALVMFLGLLLFSFSILCGWLLINNRKQAIVLSAVNQGLQLLMLGLGSFLFKYCSGIYLSFGIDFIDDTNVKADVGLSLFHLSINTGEQWEISINVIAIWILNHLIKELERRKEYNISPTL